MKRRFIKSEIVTEAQKLNAFLKKNHPKYAQSKNLKTQDSSTICSSEIREFKSKWKIK